MTGCDEIRHVDWLRSLREEAEVLQQEKGKVKEEEKREVEEEEQASERERQ